jgi:hypothetical protein
MLRRFMALTVAATFFVASPSAANDVEITVLGYPREVEGLSSFYVNVSVSNHGRHPLKACDPSQTSGSAGEPCVAVAYRKDKRPPRLLFSRVDMAPVIPSYVPVRPGETIERAVRIPTPERRGTYIVYLYLISGEPRNLIWSEIPLRVEITRRAPEATRRMWVARMLFLGFGLGTAAIVYGVLKTHAITRGC